MWHFNYVGGCDDITIVSVVLLVNDYVMGMAQLCVFGSHDCIICVGGVWRYRLRNAQGICHVGNWAD